MSNVSSEKQGDFPARGPAVPWGPVAAVVVTVLSFIGAQFLAGFVLALFFGVSGAGEVLLTSTVGQFLFVLLSDAVIFFAVWTFLRGRGAGLRQLGFGRRPVWRDIGYALLGYAAYYVLLAVVFIAASEYTQINLDQKQELGFDFLVSPGDKLMALISLVVLPPIVEEVVFRGFVFTGMRKKLKFFWATLITSLLFAGPHLLASGEGLLWVAGIDTLVLSFILCYLREKTGALWAPMTVHALKNAVAFIILLSSIAVI
ncbi:MAG TPA: type II CAAX endopeptidase family protein [Candidatus Saccharimonadales bacterium]